jgi:hypothetical protein
MWGYDKAQWNVTIYQDSQAKCKYYITKYWKHADTHDFRMSCPVYLSLSPSQSMLRLSPWFSLYVCIYTYITHTHTHTHTYTHTHRKGSREIWTCSFTNTHAATFRNNPWIILISRRQYRKGHRHIDTRHGYQDFPCTCMHAFCFSHYQRHSGTTQTPKKNVCVCCVHVCVVCVLLLKRQAVAERVSLLAAFVGGTATCKLDKHQRKWLCRAAGSPATARQLQDHLHQPTVKVNSCGL